MQRVSEKGTKSHLAGRLYNIKPISNDIWFVQRLFAAKKVAELNNYERDKSMQSPRINEGWSLGRGLVGPSEENFWGHIELK